MKIPLWNLLLAEWIYSNKKFLKVDMKIKWGYSKTIHSVNLADNNKCHIALLGPNHSILWSALNKEIDTGIL